MTRQVGGGLGTVLAPHDFLDHLRRETGDANLFCWWEPGVALSRERPGAPNVRRGCWVVFQKQQAWTNIEVSGVGSKPTVVHMLETRYVDVYKLDGAYDRPHELGAWVAEALLASCISSRGYHDRRAKILAAKAVTLRDKILAEQADSDLMARDLRPAIQFLQDHGARPAISTKEERIANMARLQRIRDRRVMLAEQHGSAMGRW